MKFSTRVPVINFPHTQGLSRFTIRHPLTLGFSFNRFDLDMIKLYFSILFLFTDLLIFLYKS